MAPQRIRRHAGDAQEQVHLYRNNADSRLQSWRHNWPECHLCPECHGHHPVTLPELNVPKSSICWPDICMHIPVHPPLNFLHLMHMPRIASMIQILIQICWLMMEHPLVCTLSAVWECSKHPFWRLEQPIERTCKWWWALIQRNGNFECISIYH